MVMGMASMLMDQNACDGVKRGAANTTGQFKNRAYRAVIDHGPAAGIKYSGIMPTARGPRIRRPRRRGSSVTIPTAPTPAGALPLFLNKLVKRTVGDDETQGEAMWNKISWLLNGG